jgi:GAF domain-containing protein
VTQELDLLNRISQALGYDLSLRDVLQLVVTMTADLMQSKICSILLYDEVNQELSIAATQSLSEDYRNKPNLKLYESVSGRAVITKVPVAIADVRVEPGFGHQEMARREGIVSLLCIPMLLKGKVIGVINSYTSQSHPYGQKQITLLSMVASQAAIAIENARLNSATLAIQKDLEARRLLDKAKTLLMAEQDLTEPEAFRMIQKKSMDTRKPMRKIAEAIILAAEFKRQKV